MPKITIKEDKILAIPSCHLNGTGKDSLLREAKEARKKGREFLEALNQMTIHSRDYYILGEKADEMFQLARDQHFERSNKIHQVVDELGEYLVKIAGQ